MNFRDWYTDRLTVFRVQNVKEGTLTRQKRVAVAGDVPCRIYRNNAHPPRMQSTAALSEDGNDKLQCDNTVDIRAGDELIIKRGGGLGQSQPAIRAFAGEPAHYYEPFGAVMPGLAHQEIALLQKEYLEAKDDGLG